MGGNIGFRERIVNSNNKVAFLNDIKDKIECKIKIQYFFLFN